MSSAAWRTPETTTQGASWLSDRGKTGDAIDVIRPLADAGGRSGADPERRLLILEAAGDGASGDLDVLRVLADLGDKKGRVLLARRLAREGHLDELRHCAESGDEYAQHWLSEAPGSATDAVADVWPRA